MLPKKHRLTKDEVEYVQKYGKVLRTSLGVIRYSSAINGFKIVKAGNVKFAVVVSKKVADSSVVRHELKRRVYRAIQEHKQHTREKAFFCAITITTTPKLCTADTIHTTIIPALRTCLDAV